MGFGDLEIKNTTHSGFEEDMQEFFFPPVFMFIIWKQFSISFLKHIEAITQWSSNSQIAFILKTPNRFAFTYR